MQLTILLFKNTVNLSLKMYTIQYKESDKDFVTTTERINQNEICILNAFLYKIKDIEEFSIKKSSMGYGFTWQEHKVYFDHENMISLLDVPKPEARTGYNDIYIVTDLMETDMHRVIYSKQVYFKKLDFIG